MEWPPPQASCQNNLKKISDVNHRTTALSSIMTKKSRKKSFRQKYTDKRLQQNFVSLRRKGKSRLQTKALLRILSHPEGVSMKISLILAHPDPKSFNHAIARTCLETLEKKGHGVFFHDLCREKFDPILPTTEFGRDADLPDFIRKHCEEIARVDGIIVVHPNWWGMPPAILKGWVDRVRRRRRRRRAGRTAQGEIGHRLQHLEHRGRTGKAGIRRSARHALEKLHLRTLRRPGRAQKDFQYRGHEYGSPAFGLARRSGRPGVGNFLTGTTDRFVVLCQSQVLDKKVYKDTKYFFVSSCLCGE
jgi:hypothetical protein